MQHEFSKDGGLNLWFGMNIAFKLYLIDKQANNGIVH